MIYPREDEYLHEDLEAIFDEFMEIVSSCPSSFIVHWAWNRGVSLCYDPASVGLISYSCLTSRGDHFHFYGSCEYWVEVELKRHDQVLLPSQDSEVSAGSLVCSQLWNVLTCSP